MAVAVAFAQIQHLERQGKIVGFLEELASSSSSSSSRVRARLEASSLAIVDFRELKFAREGKVRGSKGICFLELVDLARDSEVRGFLEMRIEFGQEEVGVGG
jgi:hypothetical protein